MNEMPDSRFKTRISDMSRKSSLSSKAFRKILLNGSCEIVYAVR